MQFGYEAMTSDGRVVRDRLDAADRENAADQLRNQGMHILRLESGGADRVAGRRFNFDIQIGRATNHRDLMLFTRQMKMLLESGAAVFPALQAILKQGGKPGMRTVVQDISDHVEQGGSLSDAFREQSGVFNPVYTSMVSAGEAGGTLPDAFNRLGYLTERQQQVRKMVLGAMIYPMILTAMLVGVVGLMLGFVIPRFATLFETLRTPLPWSTRIMLDISNALRAHWPWCVGGLIALTIVVIFIARWPKARERIGMALLRLPGLGKLSARLALGRILRIWSAMLRSHVPLLETIQTSRAAARSQGFQQLIDNVQESLASGGRIGQALGRSPLVEPVIAEAIGTGEEHGRLAEAVEFVSTWIDDDNEQLVASATRVAEPILLSLMGVLVGIVAMSLFLPLFDLASAG